MGKKGVVKRPVIEIGTKAHAINSMLSLVHTLMIISFEPPLIKRKGAIYRQKLKKTSQVKTGMNPSVSREELKIIEMSDVSST